MKGSLYFMVYETIVIYWVLTYFQLNTCRTRRNMTASNTWMANVVYWLHESWKLYSTETLYSFVFVWDGVRKLHSWGDWIISLFCLWCYPCYLASRYLPVHSGHNKASFLALHKLKLYYTWVDSYYPVVRTAPKFDILLLSLVNPRRLTYKDIIPQEITKVI